MKTNISGGIFHHKNFFSIFNFFALVAAYFDCKLAGDLVRHKLSAVNSCFSCSVIWISHYLFLYFFNLTFWKTGILVIPLYMVLRGSLPQFQHYDYKLLLFRWWMQGWWMMV